MINSKMRWRIPIVFILIGNIFSGYLVAQLVNNRHLQEDTIVSKNYIINDSAKLVWKISSSQFKSNSYQVGIRIDSGNYKPDAKLEIKSSALGSSSGPNGINEEGYRNRCLEEADLKTSCSHFYSDSLLANISYFDTSANRDMIAKYAFLIFRPHYLAEDIKFAFDIKTTKKTNVAIVLKSNTLIGLGRIATVLAWFLIGFLTLVECLIAYVVIRGPKREDIAFQEVDEHNSRAAPNA